MASPLEVNLDITPISRFQIIDLAPRIREEVGDSLLGFRKALYCSHHTTAGYLEQGVCVRLGQSRKELDPFFRFFQRLFPHDAGYQHDRIQLRDELTKAEKEVEPINADSHLTFMGAGLKNCVTYRNRPDDPVYFIELDGVFRDTHRRRRTTVLGYNREAIVHRERIEVPVVSGHRIESHNLKSPRYGLFERFEGWLDQYGIEKGRIDVRLAPEEKDVGLTVNEYETLLIRDDLPEVMRDPLRYMVERGRNLLRHPGAIPEKTRDYATYDLIHLYNEFMEHLPFGRSVVDRVMAVLSTPAYRILGLKRHVSLLVSSSEESGPGRIVHGTYQTPILVQHHTPEGGKRRLDVTLRNFA
ncbi:MAG: hypothetical protein VX733_04810 [Candidatus Latescibacterota bacterium]|nr:hypothetical protein [Candidatus Latescibacterota bacterium]